MLPTAVGDLDRLGVHDARTRFSGTSKPFTKVCPKLGVHLLKDPVFAPASKIVINGSPRREIMRKHPPGTATSQEVEDRIDNLPQPILAGPAGTLRDWDQRGNELPLGLTEVTGVTCWRRRHDDFGGEGLEIEHNISALSKENTEITVFIHPLGERVKEGAVAFKKATRS